jgi:hypothetical protein
MTAMKMSQADESVVKSARQARATTVARLAPPHTVLPPILVAVTGLFVDFVSLRGGAPSWWRSSTASLPVLALSSSRSSGTEPP